MTGEQVSAMDITKLSLTWSCQKVYAHAVIYKLIAGVLRQAKSLLSDNLPPSSKTGGFEPQRRPTDNGSPGRDQPTSERRTGKP